MLDIIEEQFFADITKETISARAKFINTGLHPELDRVSRQVMLSILLEEIGKLSRAVNKLSIIPDTDSYTDVRNQWLKEGYHRIVTSASVLRRFAELWKVIPRK